MILLFLFFLLEGKIEEIFQNLTRGASHNGHFIVYKKEDIPDTFHYKYNRRIPPILAVAENHFSFSTEKEPWSMRKYLAIIAGLRC